MFDITTLLPPVVGVLTDYQITVTNIDTIGIILLQTSVSGRNYSFNTGLASSFLHL